MSSSGKLSIREKGSAGAILSLLAIGKQDGVLKGPDGVNPFVTRIMKLVNYSFEDDVTSFTQTNFGRQGTAEITRSADLVGQFCIVARIPGIVGQTVGSSSSGSTASHFPVVEDCWDPVGDGEEPSPYAEFDGVDNPFNVDNDGDGEFDNAPAAFIGQYAAWVDNIGHALINSFSLVIGSQDIDKGNGWLLECYRHLSVTPSHDYSDMIGAYKNPLDRIKASAKPKTLYIPLNSLFCNKGVSNFIPLVALQFHKVELTVNWESLNRLIQVSQAGMTVLNTTTKRPIVDQDLHAELMFTGVYLDTAEREALTSTPLEMAIVQNHLRVFHSSAETNSISHPCNLNHPLKGFMWTVRRQKQLDAGNYFHFAGKHGEPIYGGYSILFNNSVKVSADHQYFHTYNPYISGQNAAQGKMIHLRSFGLGCVTEPGHTGSVNMSRIDQCFMQQNDVNHNLKSEDGSSKEYIITNLCAPGINTIMFQAGMGGLKYSS